MRAFIMLLFATTAGLVLSGIAANLYRLVGRKPKGRGERLFYCGVMVVAGPSVLLENATQSFRKQACSGAAYIFALAISTYWSFALGLVLINLSEI